MRRHGPFIPEALDNLLKSGFVLALEVPGTRGTNSAQINAAQAQARAQGDEALVYETEVNGAQYTRVYTRALRTPH